MTVEGRYAFTQRTASRTARERDHDAEAPTRNDSHAEIATRNPEHARTDKCAIGTYGGETVLPRRRTAGLGMFR